MINLKGLLANLIIVSGEPDLILSTDFRTANESQIYPVFGKYLISNKELLGNLLIASH